MHVLWCGQGPLATQVGAVSIGVVSARLTMEKKTEQLKGKVTEVALVESSRCRSWRWN